MMRQWCSIARVAALSTAALLFAAGPSLAQRGGGGHGGGGHGGGGGHAGGGAMHSMGGHPAGGGHVNGGHVNGVHNYPHNGSNFHHGNGNNFFFGVGFGGAYPWFYGSYYYPGGYYDNSYYSDYAVPAYNPSYYNVTPDGYANAYNYPSVGAAPANPSLATAPPAAIAPPNENAIYIRVQVPADAEVWFEDQLTTQKGPVRFFESPTLTPGRKYVYHIKARWTENGRVVEQTREYPVYAGDKFATDFTKQKEIAPPPPPKPAGS
jgi:uncharacterized protein (TIGR03000 family)